MSTEPAVSQRTAEALRELQSGLDLYRQTTGKPKGVTKEQDDSWAEQVAIILADPDYPLEPFLSDLAVLPSAISAGGAVTAWLRISRGRREKYLRWVGTLKRDRAASQKATLIPGLIEHSPETSANLLCNSSLNQKLCGRLARPLLVETGEKISLLIESADSKDMVRKILDCLLVLTGSPKISADEKWPTIRLALSKMVGYDLHEGPQRERLIHLIREQMLTFPPAIKQEMRSVLIELDANLVADFFSTQELTTESSHESVPDTEPTRIPIVRDEGTYRGPSRTKPSDMGTLDPFPGADTSAEIAASPGTQQLSDQLSDWVSSLRQKATLLDELGEHVRSSEIKIRTLEEQRKEAGEAAHASELVTRSLEAELKRANEAIQVSRRQRESLEERAEKADEAARISQQQIESLYRDLAAARQKQETLQLGLEKTEAEFSKTRRELYERIESNAERRLEGYSKRLASECAPLFRGVPPRRSPVSLETGEVLLTRLYEIIDFLENKGIRILPGVGDTR